jgi:hypothetical protein
VGGEAKISLDTDWFYRRAGPVVFGCLRTVVTTADRITRTVALGLLWRGLTMARDSQSSAGLARSRPVGAMALWTAIVLGILLVASLH